MSVLSCKLNPEGQSVSEDGSCSESWTIRVDSEFDHPLLFVGALQFDGYLPYRGGAHWLHPYFRCAGLKVNRVGKSKYHWIASAEYKLLLSEQEEERVQQEQIPNPLDRPPRITKSFDRFERAISEDTNGNAILNAAGDPWLDPVMVPGSAAVWNVTVNSASSGGWMDYLAGKTNSDAFTIRGNSYPPGSLLFEPDGESELRFENGQGYFEISFRLLVDTVNLWKEKRVQNGLNEVVDGQKRKIKLPTKDEEGEELEYDDDLREPVSDPQLLDSNGKLLENPSTANAVSVEIDKHVRTTFGGVLPNLNA